MKQLKFEPFYMTHVIGTTSAVTHVTLGQAMNEAERICRKEQKPVYVLTATNRVEPAAVPLLWVNGRKTS